MHDLDFTCKIRVIYYIICLISENDFQRREVNLVRCPGLRTSN
jgi:hypothetical protein